MELEAWVQDRAEVLALAIYGVDYYSLSNQLQTEIFAIAERNYANYHASWLDAAYDTWKDKQLLS